MIIFNLFYLYKYLLSNHPDLSYQCYWYKWKNTNYHRNSWSNISVKMMIIELINRLLQLIHSLPSSIPILTITQSPITLHNLLSLNMLPSTPPITILPNILLNFPNTPHPLPPQFRQFFPIIWIQPMITLAITICFTWYVIFVE